jgi:hypothetical protein
LKLKRKTSKIKFTCPTQMKINKNNSKTEKL